MTNTLIIAGLSLVIGTLAGFVVCTILGAVKAIKPPAKPQKGKMGAMDKILILEFFLLLTYTVVDMWVFYKTGAEPTTLTMCVFSVCGIENGVMGWIKTTKDKQAAEASTKTVDPAEMVDREEPTDVGK